MMGPFETKRLYLRRFKLEDLDDIYTHIYSDPEVCQMYCGDTATRKQVHNKLLHHVHQPKEAPFSYLAVVLKETGHVIGQVHINPYANCFYRLPGEPPARFCTLEAELAFAFGQAYWGRGLAYEACRRVIAYAFTELRLPRLMGGVVLENQRSLDLHKRLGYRIERNAQEDICDWVVVLENTMADDSP
ncbi:MAG: GNAT family N-acetyltransferase [Anaerolineae bacterium]|nr:GNAT family N-acetyltransferase [Anaerolineae bacterium]